MYKKFTYKPQHHIVPDSIISCPLKKSFSAIGYPQEDIKKLHPLLIRCNNDKNERDNLSVHPLMEPIQYIRNSSCTNLYAITPRGTYSHWIYYVDENQLAFYKKWPIYSNNYSMKIDNDTNDTLEIQLSSKNDITILGFCSINSDGYYETKTYNHDTCTGIDHKFLNLIVPKCAGYQRHHCAIETKRVPKTWPCEYRDSQNNASSTDDPALHVFYDITYPENHPIWNQKFKQTFQTFLASTVKAVKCLDCPKIIHHESLPGEDIVRIAIMLYIGGNRTKAIEILKTFDKSIKQMRPVDFKKQYAVVLKFKNGDKQEKAKKSKRESFFSLDDLQDYFYGFPKRAQYIKDVREELTRAQPL